MTSSYQLCPSYLIARPDGNALGVHCEFDIWWMFSINYWLHCYTYYRIMNSLLCGRYVLCWTLNRNLLACSNSNISRKNKCLISFTYFTGTHSRRFMKQRTKEPLLKLGITEALHAIPWHWLCWNNRVFYNYNSNVITGSNTHCCIVQQCINYFKGNPLSFVSKFHVCIYMHTYLTVFVYLVYMCMHAYISVVYRYELYKE